MQRPRGLTRLSLAFMIACLLCACGASDRSGNGSEGAGKSDLEWGPLERVAGTVNSTVTVMAPQGTATVIWVALHGAISREAPAGQPWKPEEAVPHASAASHVLAGVDEHGTVTVVWANPADPTGRYSMWSAQRPADGSWSDPVELGGGPEGDTGWQGWDLAVGPSGAAVFAWGDEDGRLRAVYRSPNGDWSPAKSLPGASWPPLPIVTIDPDGLATVAYLRDNPGLLTLAQGSAAGWEEPVNLQAKLGQRPYDIDAAGGGEVVVVWEESDHRLITERLKGGIMGDQRPLTETGARSVQVQVEAAPDGSARFVWRHGAVVDVDEGGGHPGQDMHSIYQSATGKLSEPEVIGPTGRCPPEATPFALDQNDSGDTLLAWSGEDPSDLDVAYRSHGSEVWSPQDGAVPEGSRIACFDSPAAANAKDGSAVLTWFNYPSNSDQVEPTGLVASRATISK